MKPRVRMLVAVWGPRYIERFADLSLASLLAPGNLPALAALTELEVSILTRAGDRERLERTPALARVRALCPLSYEPIDDLVADRVYGVTLTLAYHRGVTSRGEAMRDTHFLFINSDLVLADGSLRSVAQRVLRGERAILANSIRAVSEELEAPLRSLAAAGGGTLALAPRELVGMAMRALHPTQIAKIVNSGFCHSIHVNQFYWQVDADTLVSRHFLMFMLCLRPERVVAQAAGFCDYTFVTEMCPEAVPTAMEDSDEFFALEIQARDAERSYLRLGKPSHEEVARSLSEWTTRHHRDNALRHTLVFHARELPERTARVRDEAERCIRELSARLSSEPQPVHRHPYWIGAVQAWTERLRALGRLPAAGEPPTAAHPRESVPSSRPRSLVRALVVGERPRLRPWHPDWLDWRELCRLLAEPAAREGALCVQAGELAEVFGAAGAGAKHELVVIQAQASDLAGIRAAIERLRPAVRDGGRIVVFASDGGLGAARTDFAGAAIANAENIVPRDVASAEFRFVGGERKARLREAAAAWLALYRRGGKITLPIVLPALALIGLRVLLNNVRAARKPAGSSPVIECSSFLMTVRVNHPRETK